MPTSMTPRRPSGLPRLPRSTFPTFQWRGGMHRLGNRWDALVVRLVTEPLEKPVKKKTIPPHLLLPDLSILVGPHHPIHDAPER